jgi:hypothetical protein
VDCIRRKSGGGYAQVCLSSSLIQNRRGETVGGGGQAMGAGPLVHGNARGGGENGEEAEGGPIPALTSCGDGLRRAIHEDGWWPAMVSGGGELQREVEEGRCWGGVGGVRSVLGSNL